MRHKHRRRRERGGDEHFPDGTHGLLPGESDVVAAAVLPGRGRALFLSGDVPRTRIGR
jgi:hypothetical protein